MQAVKGDADDPHKYKKADLGEKNKFYFNEEVSSMPSESLDVVVQKPQVLYCVAYRRDDADKVVVACCCS